MLNSSRLGGLKQSRLYLAGLLFVSSVSCQKPAAISASSLPTASPEPQLSASPSPTLAPTLAPSPLKPTETPLPATQASDLPPPGAILVKSENGRGSLYCEQRALPESTILKYPHDLAVSRDGTTVYVINNLCSLPYGLNPRWSYFIFTYAEFFPAECSARKTSSISKRQYIYRIKPDQSPEILMHQGQPLLSCQLGTDIESDDRGNLYFTDVLENRAYQYDFQNLTKLFDVLETSSAGNISTVPPTSPYSYFQAPHNLKWSREGLYFEITSYGNAGSDNRIQRFNFATSQRENLIHLFNNTLNPVPFQNGVFSLPDVGPPYSDKLDFSKINEFPMFLSLDKDKIHQISLPYQESLGVLPVDLVVSSAKGTFYFADIKGHRIWSIELGPDGKSGVLKILAGNGTAGYQDGQGSNASFSTPTAISLDAAGNLYIADMGNHAIRKITPEGLVSTFYKTPQE